MDVNALPSLKQSIRQLKKEKSELLTSSADSAKVKRIRRKIKLLKRETRQIATQKKKPTTEAASNGSAGQTGAAAESA